jgi:hypothetical protein
MQVDSRELAAALERAGHADAANVVRVTFAEPEPALDAVLREGEEPEPQEPELLSREELRRLTPDRVRELDEQHPGLLNRSMGAL